MARTDTLGHFLTDVADAIRTKTGESGTIQASSFDTQISNIPSGGGITINGDIVDKTIQSGTISKGDFVESGEYNIIDRLSSSNDYIYYSGTSISNANNLIDNDDDTYARITGSATMPRIYFRCKNRNELNIPNNAKLLSINCVSKIKFYGTSNDNYFGAIKYRNDIGSRTVGTSQVYQAGLQTITYEELSQFLVNSDDTNMYGFQCYSGQNQKIDIYYVRFDITYLHDGEIKKATSTDNGLLGVANEDGSQGDTIEVYVPSTE